MKKEIIYYGKQNIDKKDIQNVILALKSEKLPKEILSKNLKMI